MKQARLKLLTRIHKFNAFLDNTLLPAIWMLALVAFVCMKAKY